MYAWIRVSLFLAWRAIRRGGKVGTLLNILIIAMVFTNMILLSAIMTGAVNLFHEQTVDYVTSDIIIKPAEDERTIFLTSDLLDKVNRVPGVSRASARYALGATLNHKGQSVSIPITAFNPRDEVEVTKIHQEIIEGDFLSPGDDGILLGFFVAGYEDQSMDFFESLGGVRVGDSVEVMYANGYQKEYRVKGLFSTKSYQADYMAFVSWEEMDTVLGRENTESTQILIRVISGEEPAVVKTRLLEFGVQERVETWEEAITKVVADSLETFAIINRISVAVSLIIAIVVIGIVFTIKTINQQRQIGVLKAIGIDQNAIIGSYVAQVLFIWIFGTILGMILLNLIMIYFTAHPLEFPDGDVVPAFELITMLENAGMLAVASAIAGYVPAWRIVRENTLTSMRG